MAENNAKNKLAEEFKQKFLLAEQKLDELEGVRDRYSEAINKQTELTNDNGRLNEELKSLKD